MSKRQSANYIKVFRKMAHWEWYKDTKTKALFLHCLLRASWEPGEWKGIHYEAGQFITSIANLSEETGLSVQEIRTALGHLLATRELTQDVTQGEGVKCSVITVNNWSKYQGATRKATRTATTYKEYKEKEGLPLGSAPSEEDDEWMDPSLALEQFREEQGDEGTL